MFSLCFIMFSLCFIFVFSVFPRQSGVLPVETSKASCSDHHVVLVFYRLYSSVYSVFYICFLYVLYMFSLCFIYVFSMFSGSQENCQWETFKASCPDHHVVVVFYRLYSSVYSVLYICFLYVLYMFSLCFISVFSMFSGSQEYCQWETFKASCPDHHVVVMQSAIYGRMKYGRCIRRDYGYVG